MSGGFYQRFNDRSVAADELIVTPPEEAARLGL